MIRVADESDGCDCGIQVSHVTAGVDTPASHRAFSVRQTANTLIANLIPRLWVGSSFFNTALDAET
jgi:hypothetical protein